jgi:hypothetical protein
MQFSTEASAHVLSEIQKPLQADYPPDYKLAKLWHAMMVLRANMLGHMLKNTIGTKVFSGPFKDMELTPAVLKEVFCPVLAGTYEAELHNVVEGIIARNYKTILNIGCAFGYYSVGLARRMPQTQVLAFDIEPYEQGRCRDMAIANNVADRITIGAEFRGEDFAAHDPATTLAIVDIEGAEMSLLDPAQYPSLRGMDMLVEMHDIYNAAISKTMIDRFAATHEIQFIYNKPKLFDYSVIVGADQYIESLDSMLMAWENRAGATPWAMIKARR